MRAVPGDHEHRVDGLVAEHGVEIGGRVGEAELPLRVGRGQCRRGDDCRQLDAVALCQVRQQHGRRVVARAYEGQPHRRLGGPGRGGHSAVASHRGHGHRRGLRFPLFLRLFGVPEQHSHGLQVAVLQALVRLDGVVEVGDVGDQGLHVDAAAGEEIEETRQVAALGPAHVADRVVPPLQLVRRVVAPGAVTAREPDVELLLVVRVPREVQAALADVDDPAAVPAEPGGQLDGLVAAAAGGQVHLVHAVAAGEFGDGCLDGSGRGIPAGRGAQALGELAAHRVGVGPDDTDPRGGEELHHELPDQAEADDKGHLAELRLALADALHRDRPDGAEGRVPRREAVRHRGVEVLRHPVQLGVQRVLIAGAGHEVADLHVVDPGADLLDHPAQRVAKGRVGVQLAHHLAVGGGHPVGGHALHDLGHLVRPGAGLAHHRHAGLGHLHELGAGGYQRVGAADQNTARLAPRHRYVEQRQLATLVVLHNLFHSSSS